VNRKDLLDVVGLVLLGLTLLGLGYALTIAAQEHIAEQNALPE